MPGASVRALAALEPVLRGMRELAIRVTSLEDARQLDRLLRERWSVPMIASMLQPMGYALRGHVLRQWGAVQRADALRTRTDSAVSAWATRTARSVSRLFGSLRRGAVKALRETEQSVTETVASWRDAMPTRHGSLESRLAEEIDQRVHETEQRWHRAEAQRFRARWRWISQRDSRVRRKHRALDGTEYAHDEEPSEGRPGEPYGCRCHAEWIV